MDKQISDLIDSIKNSVKAEGITVGPLLKKDPSMSEEEWQEAIKAHREKFLSGLGLKIKEEEAENGQ